MDKEIRVLLIEDSKADLELIKGMLKESPKDKFSVEVCSRLVKALERLVSDGIDIVLLDLTLPDSLGLDTFGRIHAHAPTVPIVVITSSADETQAIMAFQKGAQDYLIKGQINSDVLARSIRYAIERNKARAALRETEQKLQKINEELSASNKKLSQLSLRDLHTGLYNHKYLAEIMDAEYYRTRRYGNPVSVIMLDIDYFKSINDMYGYGFGDLILKQLAQRLKRIVRQYDIVIRSGGEEFIIISPGTDKVQAVMLARRIFDTLSIHNFGDNKNPIRLKVTMSAVSYPEDKASDAMDLIKLAERILDKAKEDGGARICSSLDRKKSGKAPKEYRRGEGVNLLRKKLEKLHKEANQNLIESIFAFAKTIELKDHYTGEHVEKTVKYATGIARELGLSAYEVEIIRQAAMLHDLGKVGISDRILTKKTKLTEKEFNEIKKHPKIAADILRPIHVLNSIIPFILYHHERWDGKGYPNGLKGEDIPLGARI
ncbi:MAG: diguanylate cyclase, partial [Candidatus Omnitrophica bacterium]|nr:diguanylate cyclase [Candidatus Omnitrophota bacterium]